MQDLLAELTSGDDTRAENSIPALVQLGMAAIPALLDLTRAEDVDSRWWAVRALAASPHTRTDDLIPLLSDSAPEVRAAAALALCSHPHESAVEALIKTLADEDSLTAGLAGKCSRENWKPFGVESARGRRRKRRQASELLLCARCLKSATIVPFQ